MSHRHIIVFVITATLPVFLEVELTEGWHVVHIQEIVGALVLLFLLWTDGLKDPEIATEPFSSKNSGV